MESFYTFITPILGLMIGLLVAGPASTAGVGPTAWIMPVMGLFVGYKNRNSRAFFYFSLFCVTVLSGVVGMSMVQPQ